MIEPYFSGSLAFAAAVCWGANSHIIRLGMKGEDLFLGLFYRGIFSFPILLVFSFFLSSPGVYTLYFTFNSIGFFVLLSVALVLIGDSFFMLALKEFPVNVIMPIAAIYPLITTLILIGAGTENISFLIILGTLFIIFGVATVTRFGEVNGKGSVSKKAIKFALGSAISWGSSVFFVTLVLKTPGSDPTSLTGFRTLLIGIFSIIFYLSITKKKGVAVRSLSEKRKTMFFMMLSGIVGWVLGATIFFIAVQNIGASIATPISSLNPIIAVILGYILKVETINIKQFLGVLLSVSGTIIILL